MEQSTSGEWILSASAELSANELEATLRDASADEMFLVPCDEDQAEEAVLKLKAMTSRPMWMDGSDAAIYESELIEALKRYPIDVVQAACIAWRQVPNHGKWWPTEQDLRVQCEKLYAPRKGLFNKARLLLQDLRIREAEKNRANDASYFAGEVHKRFRAEMAKRLLPDQMQAYFQPSHIRYIGACDVLVRTEIALAIIERYGRDVIKELGVTVKHDPTAFLRERDIQREVTPEEDAEVSRKMTRLNEAVKKGESIEKLRREGVL